MAALLMAVPLGAAISQSPPRGSHTLTVRADNDAFDFWMLPWNRPDEEYTSGVHITYSGGDAPRWSRHFLQGAHPCAVGDRVCRTGDVEIGQDIYTPSVSVDDPHAAPGSRPNAGWLYLKQGARSLNETRSREFATTIGVTGPPSLARYTQQVAHHAAPEFNRPTDWSQQIQFEPGVIARFEQKQRALIAGGELFGMDFVPRFGASVGNVLTQADAGFQVRAGWHLAHPWLLEAHEWSLMFTAGGSGAAVARNLFLDGNSFTNSPRVGHEPFVGSGEFGVELRLGRFLAAYRAVTETRSYARAPTWHPWSSLVGAITFDR
jgi:lipid A 3-O-deacylase